MTSRACTLMLSAFCVAVASNAAAQQQPWLQDRRYGEGAGIRTGNLELHPSVAAEVGYDTNYFQGSGQDDRDEDGNPTVGPGETYHAEPEVSAIRLRLTPSLTLSTLSPQRRDADAANAASSKVDFTAGISASYNEFFSGDDQYGDAVRDQRFVSGDVSLQLDILRGRPWSFDVRAGASRAVQPNNDPLFGTSDDARAAFRRTMFRGGGGVNWKPGGGLLDWHLGYGIDAMLFSEDAFQSQNNLVHTFDLRGRWLFLPRTALLYVGQAGIIDYTDQAAASSQVGATPVSSQVGVNGLVTNHFALLIMGGWKATFYGDRAGIPTEDYDGPIGRAEVTWYPFPSPKLDPGGAGMGFSSLTLGYTRDAFNSFLGNYYRQDRIYLKSTYLVAGTLVLSAEGGVSAVGRPDTYFSDGSLQKESFTEARFDAMGFAEYRLSDSLGLNLTLRYTTSSGENEINLRNPDDIDPATDVLPRDNMKFSRVEAFMGARWFM